MLEFYALNLKTYECASALLKEFALIFLKLPCIAIIGNNT